MTVHPFERLPPRGKPPATVRAIESWIQQAESKVGIGVGRLGWMVASGVVIAALQRITCSDGEPEFLLKGGTYLELRLGIQARATKDVDTLYRGDFERYVATVDRALETPFDGITFQRTAPQQIDVPGKTIKPQRFQIVMKIKGRTWRRITVEVSPNEGNVGSRAETFPVPPLAHFGFNVPERSAGIIVDYQIAQKFHACTDRHSDEHPNNRVRDVIDLHLLKRAFYIDANLSSLAAACRDLFAAREAQAKRSGKITPRPWPPSIIAHPHWQRDYQTHASKAGLDFDLATAVDELNSWILSIDKRGTI